MKEKIIKFVKKETVLTIAAILALLSAFVVHPSKEYIDYIDFRVLGILLSLMITMAGLQENGLFEKIGMGLLKRTKNTVQLCLVLVLLCFFSSMLITNDVALITFVPFTIVLLRACKKETMLIPVIVVQTVAANLGSMFTPVGNPQNLFLYNLGGFSLQGFFKVMFPYSCISLVAIVVFTLFICRKHEPVTMEEELGTDNSEISGKKKMVKNMIYLLLFILSILVVIKILPYTIVLAITVIVTFVMDREVLKKVDYCLLFTFCFFFVFTGNIGKMEVARQWLQSAIEGRTILMGTVASQVISNVPAALLLSGFTWDYEGLLIGVNLGGLGTLIASMASLISYKLYVHQYNEMKGKYFLNFTAVNVGFLLLLSVAAYILR